MKPQAIVRAREDLAAMQFAFVSFRVAKDFQQARQAWGDFVRAFRSIYMRFAAGVEKRGPSKGWNDRQQHERKSDPLLQYLYQARNADEHGLEYVAAPSLTATLHAPVNRSGGAYIRRFALRSDGTVECDASDLAGNTLDAHQIFTLSRLSLIPVTNSGQTFEPPNEHKGAAVDPAHIVGIMLAAMDHMEQMVGEAASFVVHRGH